MLIGRRHLGNAGHQDMRHRVNQTVAVLVAHAKNNILALVRVTALDHQIESELRGRNQARRFDDDKEAHLFKKRCVHLKQRCIEHIRARNNANIECLVSIFGQYADIPHIRNIGHRANALFEPARNIFLDSVSAEHDQHLFVRKQGAVHRIEGVGDQVIIEGVIEQYTLALQQFHGRVDAVVVERKALIIERTDIRAESRDFGVLITLQFLNQLIVGKAVVGAGVDGGVFASELIAENGTQKLAKQRVVDSTEGILRLTQIAVGVFLFCDAAQEETDFSEQNHAEYREEHRAQHLIKI